MIEKERNKKDSKKLKREKSLSIIDYNQILETENINTQTQASQKIESAAVCFSGNGNNLVTREKIEIIEQPKFIKYQKDNTFLRDDSDYYEKPDFEDMISKNAENEQNIENIINKYSKEDSSNKKKKEKANSKINDNNSVIYKTENTLESRDNDKKNNKTNKTNSNKNTNNKNKAPTTKNSANKNNNYSILTNKKYIATANSYLQTEKTNLNDEDSISNYDETKNYKLDLKNLKLNLDDDDERAKNSFIDPVTQRECSFIHNSDLNNSNFIENDQNKENEVVVCISNLDMKIDDSHFNNNFASKNKNANPTNKTSNFLQTLNKNSSNNFDENNFYGKEFYKNNKNNKNNNLNSNCINNNEINFKDSSSIKSKFEEIQLSLSKIKNNRDKKLFEESNISDLNSRNKKNKLKKFEIENNQNDSNRSENKDVLSTRNDKALDSKHVETEYLETDENIKVFKNKKKKRIIIIIIILCFFIFLSVFVKFFFIKNVSKHNQEAFSQGDIIENKNKTLKNKFLYN